MAVEDIVIQSVEPYVDERYEWVVATAHFAVDPADSANQRIVDLDRAPHADDGLVRFDADVRLLRPVSGVSDTVLLVVPNRGMTATLPFSLGTSITLQNAGSVDPGDGFLLERGWTIAWCGWQWDVLRETGGLGLTAPEADVDPGRLRVEWRPDRTTATLALGGSFPGIALLQFAGYPPVDLDDPTAELTVRTSPEGPKHVVDRGRWRFTDDSHVGLDGGFLAFHWYELVYRTSHAPVVGCGLLAIRDMAVHLRSRGSGRVIGYGESQCGRFLRQLLSDGLNVDEVGTTAFDGIFTSIAGAARGEFNHRYAQPSLTEIHGFGDQPPFSHPELLRRQRELGAAPKVVMTNSAWEYWRGDAALQHVDPDTGADLPEDPDVRSYLISGTDHFGRADIKAWFPSGNPTHTLDPTPVQRALLVALDSWLDGESPPDSRVPRTGDRSAATRAEVLGRFEPAVRPDLDALPWARQVDLGPNAERGVGSWPVALGSPYPDVVSEVDADGNEVAGVRLPAVAVPTAVYTGWNPRRRVDGLPTAAYERLGSKLALPPHRPTVADRHATLDDYEAAVRSAAKQLVAARLLLRHDVDVVVAEAVRGYETI